MLHNLLLEQLLHDYLPPVRYFAALVTCRLQALYIPPIPRSGAAQAQWTDPPPALRHRSATRRQACFQWRAESSARPNKTHCWVDLRNLQPCQCGNEMKHRWKAQSFLRWIFAGNSFVVFWLYFSCLHLTVWSANEVHSSAGTSVFMALWGLELKSKCSVLSALMRRLLFLVDIWQLSDLLQLILSW